MKTPLTSSKPARRALGALLALTAFAAVLVTAAPAAAAPASCARKVIDDWYDGRIDGTYDLHCYTDAIKIIPRDVRDYSSAEDDIRRALQAARRGKPAPPNQDGRGGAQSPPPATPGDPVDTTDTTSTTEGTPPANPNDPNDPGGPEVAGPVDTESASSVPIPLLILAGLALLLIAGGSAGYVIRRVQARRPPPSAA